MAILLPDVEAFLDANRRPPDPILAEMETHGARDRIPIVPPETGVLLQILARATGAARIVEIGTAIGVSTLYLARALPVGGRVVSFEVDAERHAAAKGYMERAGIAALVDLRLEDAVAGLAGLSGGWDLAFLDAVKSDYGTYLDLVVPRLRPGGLVIADNALMSGTVATGQPDGLWGEDSIRAGRAFLDRLLGHPDLIATVLPVGDGVALGVRRGG